MADITQNVAINVTANTSDATSAMTGLQQTVGNFADSAKEALDVLNTALNGITVAISAINKAFELADFADEMNHLKESVPTSALEELRQATRGTVSDLELLRTAAKGMNGDFALTADQMALVEAAALKLSERGFGSTQDNAEKLIRAFEGQTRSLRTLGIEFDASGGAATRNADLTAKLNAIVGDGKPYDDATENTKRLRTEWQNAMDAMKEGIGGLAAVILAGVIPVIRELVGEIEHLWQKAFDFAAWVSGQNTSGELAAFSALTDRAQGFIVDQGLAESRAHQQRLDAGYLAAGNSPYQVYGTYDVTQGADFDATLGAGVPVGVPGGRRGRGGGGRGGGGSAYTINAAVGEPTLIGSNFTPRGTRPLFDVGSAYGAAVGANVGQGLAIGSKQLKDFHTEAASIPRVLDGVTSAALGMAQGFQAVNQALSAFGIHMPRAFGQAFGGAMKVLGVYNLIQGLTEEAEAIGSLASLNFVGFAQHQAAAAKFFAVASQAFSQASALGAGGGTASRGGSGGSASAPGGGYVSHGHGGSQSGPSNITVHVGSDFVGNPHELAQAVSDRLRAANRAGRPINGSTAVSFS